MSNRDKSPVTQNVWRSLRRYTDARIGLGRAGISLPTSELLAFQLAHAQARDAVHFPLNVDQLVNDLGKFEHTSALGKPLQLHSQADDRLIYLQRPDLGRQLAGAARQQLKARVSAKDDRPDIAIVIADGLSSSAIQHHAAPFLDLLLEDMKSLNHPWQLAPLTLVQQARVAIGDEVAALLKARIVVVLIGERPGLSSPDSLGIYLTFGPKPGLSDAQRNCISNVRPKGLGFEDASQRLLYLIREADRLQLSGVGLKDRSDDTLIENENTDPGRNFL
jgi:ethanolamine ammonia-lyase small subunit